MKASAAESAELKMALKHEPASPALQREAVLFPLEAEEAIADVRAGLDLATPGSWVAVELERERSGRCAAWIRGVQCGGYAMEGSRFCALHGRGSRDR